jgi:leader peptidase (prepilin peptidase)/N-methyltransferase
LLIAVLLSIPWMFLTPTGLKSVTIVMILSILYACAYNDIRYRQIDDILILCTLILSFIATNSLKFSIVRFLVICVVFVMLILFTNFSLGGGDIKLLCALSALLTVWEYLLMLGLSCAIAIVGYLITKALKVHDYQRIPFGLYIFISVYGILILSQFGLI